MIYRPEIDGLRTVAILPVVLFHAGFQWFSGGFVGVDVFFVISGYLITLTLLQDLAENRFSIARFYERRARRILPALFSMVIVCVPFAWFWMTPERFAAFAQNIMATALFFSNYQFAASDGYFAYEAAKVPLLHTWSLAIEEQFYIIFPIFLAISWKFLNRQTIIILLVILTLSSLALTEWGWRNSPINNFYLIQFRAWELLIGTICAFLHFQKQPAPNNLLSGIGFALVLFAIFSFDETTRFPSLLTLAPVLGSALIILFANQETIIGKMLSLKPMVAIGLISYSVYIWHQPVFAFAETRFEEYLTFNVRSGLILLVLCLAWASWKFIETPFRKTKTKTHTTTRQALKISGVSIVLLTVFGLIMINSNLHKEHFISTLSAKELTILKLQESQREDYHVNWMQDNGDCVFYAIQFKNFDRDRFENCSKKHGQATVVLGDSHGINAYNMLARSKHAKFLVGFVRHGCRPEARNENCDYDKFAKFATSNHEKISIIYYHQAGSSLMLDYAGNNDTMYIFDRDKSFGFDHKKFNSVSSYLDELSQFNKVIWLGPFTEARVDLTDVRKVAKTGLVINQHVISVFADFEKQMRQAIQGRKSNFTYVSLHDVLLINQNSLLQENCITFFDLDHFSKCGETIYGTKLSNYLLNN